MSYIEKNEDEQNKQNYEKKLANPIKSIIAEDTIVENPEDIIDRDPDTERKNAFKRAQEILALIFPETAKKRKKREKEEFDKSIEITLQNQRQKEQQIKEQKEKLREQEKDRGMERGE